MNDLHQKETPLHINKKPVKPYPKLGITPQVSNIPKIQARNAP